MAVGADEHGAGCGIFRNGGHDEVVGADENGSCNVADLDRGTAIVRRAERASAQADFASRKRGARFDGFKAGVAVDVFLA
jgi:hypothetical protein